jgi:hypothetical protein
MAQLDTYLKILKGEIGSAKVIGDGYAWIFYRTDDHLIDEHLKRQRQTNLPPGVGGIGERAFVEKLQGWNRQFVFPTVLPGTLPLVWWPISKKNLYDLVFGRVIILSMYNPAHFWGLLRSRGYTVTTDDRSRFMSAINKQDKRTVRLENMDYFRQLTENFLMSDETVFNVLEKAVSVAETQGMGSNVKVNLVPRMKLR